MFKVTEKNFKFGTDVLSKGIYINEPATNPEATPIYMTTAFNVEDLDDLQKRYDEHGFCYNRNRNPNRSALVELMSYAEHGEDSIICSSGMAAISTAIISNLKQGDHIVSDMTLYGETIDIFTRVLEHFGVETTFVDFTDTECIKAAIQPNTRILYTETVSNPMITVPNLKEIADIAHNNNAIFIVDNTFMTCVQCRPLDFGADIVVNSLTKFANGHSDAVCGSATGKMSLIKKAYELQVLLGTQADPFSCWLVQRGFRTIELRLKQQAKNGEALAKALEKSPYVLKVNHPSLINHPQHKLAMEQFNGFGGMLSVELPEDRDKMNKFMRSLSFAHYAMTLGGYRTTLSYPVMSSHYDVPKEERLKMGITDGLLRVSCGIEDTDDLVNDFLNALEIAYK
ncbi:trans-sulfuration enzyme family protein [Veillonella criceti]|uniref:homocysteine desulfhydrase n=1 Tax=Veillonella criceti TaxID=103891 RepID=A0A380NL86_9FIRM|nr:PLP-dependent aspartate aminotransferase family protein [Veillonella criceti]SUP43813.1 Cystathionine beta-lyase metC [Veillonella criceti]